MRILVTGATGFVGRHLVPALVKEGYVVRGTRRAGRSDSFREGPQEWADLSDITSASEWLGAAEDVDAVIHLAGLAHQIGPGAEIRESEYQRANAGGSERLAEAAKRAGVRRVIMISSIAVLGPYDGTPFTEASPALPETAYGRSKLEGERAVQRILISGQTDWSIIRPPLVYGPGNPGNMARLLGLIDRGLPLPLGRLDARRSYLYAGNLVDLLTRCVTHPGASRRVFLVDDGKPIETRELIRQLAVYAGKPARLFPVPLSVLRALGPLGDQLERLTGRSMGINTYSIDRLLGSLVIDSRAVQNALGWSPPFSQEAGFRRTVQPEMDIT